jgi:L-idonate 5-dehydrogenase
MIGISASRAAKKGSVVNNNAACYVLYGAEDVRLERRPTAPPASGMVLVHPKRMGICGSDVHYYRHGSVGAFVPSRPFVLGHEAVGVVAAIGEGIAGLAVGDRVAIDPSQPCRVCRACTTGRYNLCARMVYLGSASTTPPTDGVFQERVVVPAACCHRVPDTLDDGRAALIEPLAVALHALRQGGGVEGATLLVTGGGTIGQLVVMAARAYGAELVTLSEPAQARRSCALRHGADSAFEPGDERLARQARGLLGGGFDVVVEASGAPPALCQALALARPGGTVVQVGTLPSEVSLPANQVMVRELRLVGSFRFANVFGSAIALASAGRVALDALITHTLPFARFREAMALACAPEAALKVQIDAEG